MKSLPKSPGLGSENSCSFSERMCLFFKTTSSAKLMLRLPVAISLCRVEELQSPIFMPYCFCACVTISSLNSPTSFTELSYRLDSKCNAYIKRTGMRLRTNAGACNGQSVFITKAELQYIQDLLLVTNVSRKLKLRAYLLPARHRPATWPPKSFAPKTAVPHAQ